MTGVPPIDPRALETAAQDLSDTWLTQAFLELTESLGLGEARSLVAAIAGTDDKRPGLGYFMARLNSSRKAVAFSAFAAEAYINRLLHSRLSGQDRETALNLRPVSEKFAFATRVALAEPLLRRDEALYRDMKELFSLRNRLVHATPRTVEPGAVIGEAAFAECNPLVAHRFVVATAEVARKILQELDPPAPPATADMVISMAAMLLPHAERAAAVPPPTAEQIHAELEEARRMFPQFFLEDEGAA